ASAGGYPGNHSGGNMIANTVPPPRDVATAKADLLLLVRLLPQTKKPLAPASVRRGLARLLPQPITTQEWQQTLDRLRGQGLIEPKALRLTDAGWAQALAFLGVPE